MRYRKFDLVVLAVFLLVLVAMRFGLSAWAPPPPSGIGRGRWLLGLALGGGFYLASHVARSIRLAVIAGEMLGVSLRTAAVLHFFVAPWSIILPFKLDELLRWNELTRVGRSPVRALLVGLIDRSADGLVLIVLLSVLAQRHDLVGVGQMAALLTVAMAVIISCFVLLPVMLEMVQQHLFQYNFTAMSVRMMALIDRIRTELAQARDTMARWSTWLLFCTFMTWLFELAAVGSVLVVALGQPLSLAVSVRVMLLRAGNSATILAGGGDDVLRLLSLLFVGALGMAWLVATPIYIGRLRSEPRRAAFITAAGDAAQKGKRA